MITLIRGLFIIFLIYFAQAMLCCLIHASNNTPFPWGKLWGFFKLTFIPYLIWIAIFNPSKINEYQENKTNKDI